VARIDDQVFFETETFVRRYRSLATASATRDRAVAHFQRKLCEWVTGLNDRIWRFHITGFEDLGVLRYEEGDEVRPHADLGGQYCDRKLLALVQLSPPDAYRGGELGFGLPGLSMARHEQGSLLVFPAWVTHRVAPTTFTVLS
jgi:hypothetical protein